MKAKRQNNFSVQFQERPDQLTDRSTSAVSRDHSQNNISQTRTKNKQERSKQLEIMGTIIARNEEIERELKIVTRALELREDSTRNIPELEKMIAQMQNQLTLEKKITQELEYLRSQDKLEMTKMDSELKSLRDKNRDLQKQVELSGNLLEDKIQKVDEQQDKIQTLRDELMMLSQNSEREIRQLNEEIKTQSKDNMGLSYQMKELQKQVRDQFLNNKTYFT